MNSSNTNAFSFIKLFQFTGFFYIKVIELTPLILATPIFISQRLHGTVGVLILREVWWPIWLIFGWTSSRWFRSAVATSTSSANTVSLWKSSCELQSRFACSSSWNLWSSLWCLVWCPLSVSIKLSSMRSVDWCWVFTDLRFWDLEWSCCQLCGFGPRKQGNLNSKTSYCFCTWLHSSSRSHSPGT